MLFHPKTSESLMSQSRIQSQLSWCFQVSSAPKDRFWPQSRRFPCYPGLSPTQGQTLPSSKVTSCLQVVLHPESRVRTTASRHGPRFPSTWGSPFRDKTLSPECQAPGPPLNHCHLGTGRQTLLPKQSLPERTVSRARSPRQTHCITVLLKLHPTFVCQAPFHKQPAPSTGTPSQSLRAPRPRLSHLTLTTALHGQHLALILQRRK